MHVNPVYIYLQLRELTADTDVFFLNTSVTHLFRFPAGKFGSIDLTFPASRPCDSAQSFETSW